MAKYDFEILVQSLLEEKTKLKSFDTFHENFNEVVQSYLDRRKQELSTLTKEEKKQTRNKLRKNYLSPELIDYFLGESTSKKSNINTLEKKTVEAFLNRDYVNYDKAPKKYKRVLDILSVFLGFDGWKDGVRCKFNIEKKEKSEILLTEQKERTVPERVQEVSARDLDEFLSTLEEFKEDIKKTIDKDIFLDSLESKILSDNDYDDSERIRDLFASNPKLFEKVVNRNSELNIEKAFTDQNQFVNDLFNELIYVEKIHPDLADRIDTVLNKKKDEIIFDWSYRAVLASSLTLSVLNGWDRKKIDYLRELAGCNYEPYVAERAVIGLVLALIISQKRSDHFEDTMNAMHILSESEKYRAWIFECINFLYTHLKDSKISTLVQDLRDEFNLRGFQFFEPPNENCSYFKVKKKLPISNQKTFFSMVNSSVLVGSKRKFKVFFKFNQLNTDQLDRIEQVFEKSEKKATQLKCDKLFSVYSLVQRKELDSFFSVLKMQEFNGHYKALLGNLEIDNSRNMIWKLSERFPFLGYLKFKKIDLLHEASFRPDRVQDYGYYLADLCSDNSEESRKLIINIRELFEILLKEKIELPFSHKILGWCSIKLVNLTEDIEQQKGYYAHAIENFEISLDYKPDKRDKAWLHRKIGLCYGQLIDLVDDQDVLKSYFEESIKNYQEALLCESTDPMKTFLNERLGWCYSELYELVIENDKKKCLENAVLNYEQTLLLESTNSEKPLYHRQLGWCYLKLVELVNDPIQLEKYYELASQNYGESLYYESIDTKIALAHRQRGWCMLMLERLKSDDSARITYLKSSIKDYEMSTHYNSTDREMAWSYRQLGWCNYELGALTANPKKRKVHYQSAISNNLESLNYQMDSIEKTAIYRHLGWLFLLLKQIKKSKAYCKKAFGEEKEKYALGNYAHCEIILEKNDSALKYYKKSADAWKYSQDFFDGLEGDFQKVLKPQGVSKKTYQEIIGELREYCESKK